MFYDISMKMVGFLVYIIATLHSWHYSTLPKNCDRATGPLYVLKLWVAVTSTGSLESTFPPMNPLAVVSLI